MYSPPDCSSQSATRSTAAGMLLSETSKVKLGNMDLAISSRINSCSRMNGANSLYCDGLPETFNRSSRADAKLSGERVQKTILKFRGNNRSSSQRKSYSLPYVCF